MTILVIGGTGTIGANVVRELADQQAKTRVLVRDPAKAKLPAGIEIVSGDLTDPDSIRRALEGVDTLFLLNAVVPDELTQALATIGLARDAGLKGIVYFSVLNSDLYTDVPHFAGKNTVERMIAANGLPATILRPGTFMQNDANMKQAITAGVYPLPIGDKGVAMVDAADIATIAAHELLRRERASEPLPPETIEIAGPEDLTGASVARIWQEVLGRDVAYAGDDVDAFETQMKSMAPAWLAYDMRTMNLGFQRYGMRIKPETRADLERRLGQPLRTYRDFAEQTARGWQ